MSELAKIYRSGTFVLIPRRRTFIQGISALLDSSNREILKNYSTSATQNEADSKALAADWREIGKDLEIAYEWGRKELAK